jgi:hypothetical protein
MGYEFLIRVKLTAEEKDGLIKLFERKPGLSSTATANPEQYFEFKRSGLQWQLPDFTIAFDENGIYICQYLTTNACANLIDIKEWLEKQEKDFNVEEL